MPNDAVDLPNGTTSRVHADFSIREMEKTVREVIDDLRSGARLYKEEREFLSRRLAGVVAHAECLRRWLESPAAWEKGRPL